MFHVLVIVLLIMILVRLNRRRAPGPAPPAPAAASAGTYLRRPRGFHHRRLLAPRSSARCRTGSGQACERKD